MRLEDLLTAAQIMELERNSGAQSENMRKHGHKEDFADLDFTPVVKLFTPGGSATWLFTEMDEDGRLFGLCDLGMGEPELGYVGIEELLEARDQLGLPIEVDKAFVADGPLSDYTYKARKARRIVT